MQPACAEGPHNLILFVPDGLRALMVDEDKAPAMAALRAKGVNFKNPHALFPTFTTANASAMATGHYLGDTGDFSNAIYAGYPVPAANNSITPFLEYDQVLGDIDARFGDYLDEETLLAAARSQGFSTAAIGKLGPALIFDHTDRSGEPTIVVDDSTGRLVGIPLSKEVADAMMAAGLPLEAPCRCENGKSGDWKTPGTKAANVDQQDYFSNVTTKVVLPLFKARNRPFVLVFWSRDPDGTQHNQGDRLNEVTPGINGPTSLLAIKNADTDLAKLQSALAELGLADTTDIIVAADHGFSTISKQSATSLSVGGQYKDVKPGFLPPGFVAIDVASALGLPLFDPDKQNAKIEPNNHPWRGNGAIGNNPADPDVVVAANGGSDLIYFPHGDRTLAARTVDTLLGQDYVSGLFVDDQLGNFPGTLPLSAINLKGAAVTPVPAIVINFKSFDTGCGQPLICAAEISDTVLQQGQGMHGSFSRADTMNFMAAIGPDFKQEFTDEAPVSNVDIGRTIARILSLKMAPKGALLGRVLTEAMPGNEVPAFEQRLLESPLAANGLKTVLKYEVVGETRYFDAAGFRGKTVGLGN